MHSVNVVPQMDIMTAVSEVLKNALHHEGLQRGLRLAVKALDRGVAQICYACNAGDLGSIPGLGRYPGVGNGNPLQ